MKRTQQTALSVKEREMTEQALAYVPKQKRPRPFTNMRSRTILSRPALRERQAQEAERDRDSPHVVVCDCNGKIIVFGRSDQADGGAAMYWAKLTPWAKNPRVVGLLPG